QVEGGAYELGHGLDGQADLNEDEARIGRGAEAGVDLVTGPRIVVHEKDPNHRVGIHSRRREDPCAAAHSGGDDRRLAGLVAIDLYGDGWIGFDGDFARLEVDEPVVAREAA